MARRRRDGGNTQTDPLSYLGLRLAVALRLELNCFLTSSALCYLAPWGWWVATEHMLKQPVQVTKFFYQWKVHEHLHAISWSHMSHMVEIGWIRNHFGSELRVSEHLSKSTKTQWLYRIRGLSMSTHHVERRQLKTHRRCCNLSSSGTLKTNLLLLLVRSICFLLLSDVSGTQRAVPVVTRHSSVAGARHNTPEGTHRTCWNEWDLWPTVSQQDFFF